MKKRTGITAVILTISILLTGCSGKTVEQKNDSLSFHFFLMEMMRGTWRQKKVYWRRIRILKPI